MCGRFGLIAKIEEIAERYNSPITPELKSFHEYDVNIAPGKFSWVITSDKRLKRFTFGLTPFWAKKRKYLFNARMEGDHNKENDPKYKGAKGIIVKPSFRKPIRQQRCLVPASFFIEGTTKEGLDKPFLIHHKSEKLFSFAGIWDAWKDNQTGSDFFGFSIITTTANELIQKIPHHRSPVIIPQELESVWLNENAPLSDITAILKPFPSEMLNAFPISNEIKNPGNNRPDIIKPVGKPFFENRKFIFKEGLALQGMGKRKKTE